MNERDYAFRRVLYDSMLLGRALVAIKKEKLDFQTQEAFKTVALLKVRSLAAFMEDDIPKKKDGTNKYPDDATILDFGLPVVSGLISNVEKSRLHKIVAHTIKRRVPVFRNRKTIYISTKVLAEAASFTRTVRTKRLARLTGKGRDYLAIFQDLLAQLGLATV